MIHNTQKSGVATPTVNVAVNKNRLKTYLKDGKPVFYLKKGAEFQLELFNPTSDVISARISINGTRISQRGLVLKPGVRIFLDRYLDIAKKFKFDTYEVSNSKEVAKAIEDNGSITVDFYREEKPDRYRYYDTAPFWYNHRTFYPSYNDGTWIGDDLTVGTCNSGGDSIYAFSSSVRGGDVTNLPQGATVGNDYTNTGMFSQEQSRSFAGEPTLSYTDTNPVSASVSANMSTNSMKSFKPSSKLRMKSKKTIETGRVEQGSSSSQTFKDVNMSFEYSPFCTLTYKLLPESVKEITTSELNKRRYCYNCGSKTKPNFKFCPNCGSKS